MRKEGETRVKEVMRNIYSKNNNFSSSFSLSPVPPRTSYVCARVCAREGVKEERSSRSCCDDRRMAAATNAHCTSATWHPSTIHSLAIHHKIRYFQHLRSAQARGNNRKDRPSLLRLSGFTQSVLAQGFTCDGEGWYTSRTWRLWDAIVAIGAQGSPSRPGPNTGEPCTGLD